MKIVVDMCRSYCNEKVGPLCDAVYVINQSINHLQNSRLSVRQESIELAGRGHLHTIKPQL